MSPRSRRCWEKTSEARCKAESRGLGHDREERQPASGRRRHASTLAGIDPRVYRRRSTRPADTELRERLKELSSERRRFGYRRLHLLLGREGWKVNWKKLYRIYREEGLTVRKRGGRKRALGTRAPMAIPQGQSRRGRTSAGRWTSCQTACPMVAASGCSASSTTSAGNAWPRSWTPRCQGSALDVSSTASLGCAAIHACWSATTAARQAICKANLPRGGTELTSNAILSWQEDRKVEWHYIAPGKPMQNGFVESFNGRLRPSRDIALQCPAGQWTSASTSTCSQTCATPGS